MKIKKLLIAMLVALLAFAACACGADNNETAEESVPNPFVDVESADALCEATGMSIDAPEGASDVVYSYCQDEDGGISFSQVRFTYDGDSYCYRCQDSGDVTSIEATLEDGAEGDLLAQMSHCINVGAALAGMHYDWQSGGTYDIADRNAVFAFNEGEAGFVAWLDVAPGVLYSLSIDDNADQMKLVDTAELVFVPMQGEA